MFLKKEFYKIPNKYLNNPIFKDYNKALKNRIPTKVGVELENLCEDSDSIVLIHRTQLTVNGQSSTIAKIFLNGLINDGENNFRYTLTECSTLPFLLGQLVATQDYRQCEGCIIAKVPKASIGYNGIKNEPIWYMQNDGKYYLLPQYIYGYAVCKNGKVSGIIKNPAYAKNIEIDYANRIYDDSALPMEDNVILK